MDIDDAINILIELKCVLNPISDEVKALELAIVALGKQVE